MEGQNGAGWHASESVVTEHVLYLVLVRREGIEKAIKYLQIIACKLWITSC